MSTDRPLPPTTQPRPMMDTSDTSMPPEPTRSASSMPPMICRQQSSMGVPPADVPQVPELSLPPILEAAEETKPVEAPAETKPVEAPAETKPEEAPAEAKPEEAPAETKPEEAPAETKPEEAPAEKKPDEAIINEVVKDVVQDALGVPRAERSNAKPEGTPDEAPKAPETGNDKIDEAKEVYDELVKGADFDPPPDIKRAHSDVAEEDSKASKVAKVDVMEPQTPRPVTSTA